MKLNKFYLFTIIIARFTEINISNRKLRKHYFNMLAELNKYGFQCSASSPSELNWSSVVDKAVDQWRPRLRTHVRDKGQHFGHLL